MMAFMFGKRALGGSVVLGRTWVVHVVTAVVGVFIFAIFTPETFPGDGVPSPLHKPGKRTKVSPADAALDARMSLYLQKSLMIPDPSRIQLGPMGKTAIDGLYFRDLRITNVQRGSLKASILTDVGEDRMLLVQGPVQAFDLTRDTSEKADSLNPAPDARMTTHLQKSLEIGDPSRIELGAIEETEIKGLYHRDLRVTSDSGDSLRASIFTNANEDQMFLIQAPVQAFDVTKDPWQKVDLSTIHLEDRPVMGSSKTAQVTIVEFADFECPFCARAFGILETMIRTRHPGKVQLIYKNYTLQSHPWSTRAALSAECARLQNPEAFWEFARGFYNSQDSISTDKIDDQIRATAKVLKLDLSTLKACMSAASAKARIQEDQRDGDALGVTTTPTLFINGVQLIGMPEEEAFDWMVSQQLVGSKEKEMLLR
jgi:protein-disulfide isomerase